MKSQPWSNQVKSRETLPVAANSPYYFLHNVKNWEMYEFQLEPDGKRKKADVLPLLLPSFSTLRITGGVNGVRDGKNPDPSIAIAKMQNEGIQVFNPREFDYLRMFPARGGSYHTDKWTSVQVIGNEAIFEFDHKGFAEFRRDLILSLKIKLPHKHFIQLMKIGKQRSIDRIAQDQHIPERAIQLRKRQKEIQDLISFETRLQKLGVQAYELQV